MPLSAEANVRSGTPSLPTDPAERIEALDIIRGIAVFGLAWVHLTMDGGLFSALDHVATWTVGIVAEKKFQAMFATLLGVSLALQMERSTARDERFAGRWLRRMLALYAIGWITAVLISHGEILRSYAIAGVVALLFHRMPTRALLVSAALLVVLWVSGPSLSTALVRLGGGDVGATYASVPDTLRTAERAGYLGMRDASVAGNYVDMVVARARLAAATTRVALARPLGALNLIPLNILAFVLLGLWAGRKRLVQERQSHGRSLRRIAWIGIGAGLPLNVFGYWLLFGSPPGWLLEPTAQGFEYRWLVLQPASIVLGGGYLAALLLVLGKPGRTTRLQPLAAAGRMGFTNYLINLLLVSTFLFTLGLAGTFGRFAGTVSALVFFGVQMLYSRWWLARFRFGPIEWLWRTLTYGRRPAMRRSIADPARVADLRPT